MTQLPSWVLKVQAAWLGLGTLLTILAFQSGLPIPSFLNDLFTQATWDIIVQAASALFTAYQVLRSIFVATPKPAATVSTLSTERVRNYAWNPFKLAA